MSEHNSEKQSEPKPEKQSEQEAAVRVNKFLSEAGFCSRRDADKLLDQGLITINDQPIEMGTKVLPGDQVKVRGKLVNTKPKRIYLALNKPPGITCTTAGNVAGNIVDFINYPERIFPIGRLDKPSEGLILLTNDGDIVNKILRAGNNHEKEYLVTVDKPVTDRFIQQMAGGVPILDTVTNKCKVTQTSKFGFEIILTQGLNRQIRRMCEHLGYRVQKLKRMRIMNLIVDNIGIGQWRHLTEREMYELNQLITSSSKTMEASQLTPMQLAELSPAQPNDRHGYQHEANQFETSQNKAKQNKIKTEGRIQRQKKDRSEDNVWSRNKTKPEDKAPRQNRGKSEDNVWSRNKVKPEDKTPRQNKGKSEDNAWSGNKARSEDKTPRQNREKSEDNVWSRNKTKTEDKNQRQDKAKPEGKSKAKLQGTLKLKRPLNKRKETVTKPTKEKYLYVAKSNKSE
ncbi:MAG: 23S rRNA pseudouridine(2604) synthase RluF [Amphritea sp.]